MSVDKVKTKDYILNIPEKVYEELYSKADILYFLIHPEGSIVSCNTTALEVLGYENKELSGKKFLELVSDSDFEEVDHALNNCRKKGYLRNQEACLKESHGRIIHVVINGLSGVNASGDVEAIRLYITNVSELNRIKQKQSLSLRIFELLKEESVFEKLLENVLLEIQKGMHSDGIGLFLEENNGKKLTLGKWNRMTSVSDDDPENFKKWPAEVWQQIITGCSLYPLCHNTASGSVFIESLSNLLIEMSEGEERECLVSLADYESVGIISLKTGQFKRGCLVLTHTFPNQWQLDDIEWVESVLPPILMKKHRPASVIVPNTDPVNLLLNISIFGILFVKDGIVQSVNPWIEEFLGLSSDLINGRSVTDFVAQEYRDRIKDWINGSQSKQNQQCELVILTKDGKRRWIESNFASFGNHNEMTVWYWISKEERERLQEQLIQARKMESIGILAGGIVHDFNNLLASILGHSSLLSEDIPKNSPFYNDVQQIIRTSEKATELTSRLLAYAQEGSKQVHQLDINQLIKEVAGILSRTLDKSITIRAELNSELASVMGDPGQIQHAILEVTLNARDALSNGGKIVFQTGHIELNENTAQMHSEAKPGKYVQLTISDSGVGMSSEVKEQIFEPYFTTKKEEDPARGLGLSMVQEIIEKHGGFISVFSEKNKGTVFKIHLPVCEKPVKSSRKAPTQDSKPTLGKETILLVANENVLKQTARKMLTRYGYKVICADSGTEAIAIYKKYTKRVNLVILDLIMTGMETSKILTWLKKLNPKVKIIAAAGLGEKELFDKSVRANLSAVIQKPYQVRPLLQQVRNVLNA